MLLAQCPVRAQAASLSAKDVKIIAKALGFLVPAPSGGVVAVVYSNQSPGSKEDAEAIAAEFGDGQASSGGSVTARPIESSALGHGGGYIAVIVASGAPGDAVKTAAKAQKIPSITASMDLVQSGQCTMAVQSEPKVDITVSHAAAQETGISFASAFQMLIHEK